jgi:TPP-dependent pyruvate/acetoin dehydrogenase alpha subunit
MLRKMLLLRAFDDRMFRAQRQGKTSFYMKSFGEEATSVATTMALHSDDMCFPSYRQQGMLITRHDVASPLTFSKTNRAPWGGVDFEITFHVLDYAG